MKSLKDGTILSNSCSGNREHSDGVSPYSCIARKRRIQMKRLLVFLVIAIMTTLSPLTLADGEIGSFWMDPIKMWSQGDKFTLWFSPNLDDSKLLHFCLSARASWGTIGNSGFHVRFGSWIHYWVNVNKDTSEITFQGSLPNKVGQVSLVRLGEDKLKCGSEGVTINIE